LAEVPGEWLEPTVALHVLRSAKLRVPRLQSGRIVFEELELPSASNFNVEVIHAFELYCGMGNFYKAVMSSGLHVGFLGDRQLPQWARAQCSIVDLLIGEARQLVWACGGQPCVISHARAPTRCTASSDWKHWCM
jgi:hypothetical protein